MVYIAYFTELNLQICDYAQKRSICLENCEYALVENFPWPFLPPTKGCQVLPPCSHCKYTPIYCNEETLEIYSLQADYNWWQMQICLFFHQEEPNLDSEDYWCDIDCPETVTVKFKCRIQFVLSNILIYPPADVSSHWLKLNLKSSPWGQIQPSTESYQP